MAVVEVALCFRKAVGSTVTGTIFARYEEATGAAQEQVGIIGANTGMRRSL